MNDLLASLDRLERGLGTVRRRTLIIGLAAIAVANLVMILAVRS